MSRILLMPQIPLLFLNTFRHVPIKPNRMAFSSLDQYDMIRLMSEAKTNNAPLEEVMKPLVEYKKYNKTPLNSVAYSALIDFCSTNEELDAVLMDMNDSRKYIYFMVKDVLLHMDTKKIERICDSIKRISKSDSLPITLKSFFSPPTHAAMDNIFAYAQDLTNFNDIIKDSDVRVTALLMVISKLENYDHLASQLKNKLLHDNDAYEFAKGHSCWAALRVLILDHYIAGYRNSWDDEHLDKIETLLGSIEDFDTEKVDLLHHTSSLLVNLYKTCLEKNNIELAIRAFDIFKYTDVRTKCKEEYFTNLLHLQALAVVRTHNTSDTNILTTFTKRPLIQEVQATGILPSASLFTAYLHWHMAHKSFPSILHLRHELNLLLEINKEDEILEILTDWTHYYTPNAKFPVDIFCNLIYIIIYVANKFHGTLSVRHVDDILSRLNPFSFRSKDEKSAYVKAVHFFDEQLDKIHRTKQSVIPIGIHNLILYGFSMSKNFVRVQEKFNDMVGRQIQGNVETFKLIIDLALARGIEDECKYVYTTVWRNINRVMDSKSIPKELIKGMINCCLITRNEKEAISFIQFSVENKIQLSVRLIDTVFSSCYDSGVKTGIQHLKKVLESANDVNYEAVIEKCTQAIQ